MSKPYSSRETLRVLERFGLEQVSQRDSHVKLRLVTSGGLRTVIVPHPRPQLPPGTFGSILKAAGMSLSTFEDLL